MKDTHYYHCATDGLKDDVLFPSVNAFISGMNRIAVCFIKAQKSFPVLIFAFCLMDNHVHFVLYGTKDNCRKFMKTYQALTEIWLTNHPEEGSPGKKWNIGVWLLPDRDALIEKIIYVLRNPMAAALPFTPNGYKWGSGTLLFNNDIALQYADKLEAFHGYRQRYMFNTREVLPQDWLVFKDGMIWPGCYTEYKRVEQLFRTAASFIYECNKKVEPKVNAEMKEDFVSLPDNEVSEKALALAQSLFGKSKISDLSVSQRTKVASLLKKQTETSVKQLARIVRLKYEDLKLLI